MSTIYKINFDFTSAEQKKILDYLQDNNYRLMGYKGASGVGQVKAGLPTWFSVPYDDQFGNVEIDYEPLYKVYAYNRAEIGTNTIIEMSTSSEEVPLGTALTFHQDGTFTKVGDAQPGIITVNDKRKAGTSKVTVGLAAKVNGEYAPFCAFTLISQNSVSMEPNERAVLFAAQTKLVSGSVVGNTAAPGCAFEFNSSHEQYSLEMMPGTYGIKSVKNGAIVEEIPSGESLKQLLSR